MTTPSEDYRLIPLTQGQSAKVDATDYEWLMQWKWCASWYPSLNGFYALRSVRIGVRSENRKQSILMHRQILGLERGDAMTVDHIHHDTLDNRRSQLRIVNQADNNRNQRRARCLRVRLTHSEFGSIKDAAERSGQTVDEWVIGRIIDFE